jgi:hypothetical protein
VLSNSFKIVSNMLFSTLTSYVDEIIGDYLFRFGYNESATNHMFSICLIEPGILTIFFSLALQPAWALASDFQFHDHFTDGRTPWMSDQLVARPLPEHRTTQTE